MSRRRWLTRGTFVKAARQGRVLISAVCLVLFLTGGQPAPAASSRRTQIVEVVERVRSAVVNIHSERTVQSTVGDDLTATPPAPNHINGMGTGVIIDPRGYVVTNEHVIEDVNVIRVRLSDGTSYPARVLARSQENDLALLKFDAGRPLPVIPLGTATDLMVGETVIAIGNAYGYEHTVTVGIVSAVKRDVTLNKDVAYKALIQTDASINPGNSGGPLLNINGEMVGVNVAIRAGAQGISFAIPVDTMIRVVADMISVRRRKGTCHGLICHDQVDPSQADTPVRRLVLDHPESASPAERAGLQPGDVVLQVADTRVTCSLDLERALLGCSAGEHVPVVVRRRGAEQRVDLVLQNAESENPTAAADLIWQKIGLRLSPVTGELISRTSDRLSGGLVVEEINPEGSAAKAGIQRGDVLVGLHHWKTLTLDNVVFVLTHRDLATFTPLCFYIVRSGQIHRGWIQQID
jgi:serine protease Do